MILDACDTALAAAQRELKVLIEYAAFLGEAEGYLLPFAAIHGLYQLPTLIEKGRELRSRMSPKTLAALDKVRSDPHRSRHE